MTTYYLGLIGVAVFAISGALAADKRDYDWVGVIALSTVTALGGGTTRDVLLRRDAVFWISDPTYLWVVIGATFFTIGFTRYFKPPHKSLLIADALGLALFTIGGAQIAEASEVSFPIVIVMGIITGVVGGIIRDVLTNETPLLFRASEPLYSIAALSGLILYLILQQFELKIDYAALAGMITIALVRFAAIYWNFQLPSFSTERKSGV